MPGHNNRASRTVRRLSKDGSVHVTDESINTVSSMIGACFALVGSALLIVQSAVHHSAWAIVGFSIYALGLLSLFVFSALHHGVNGSERTNQVLRTFDYLSVFLLITGTITPLVLVRGRNAIGWTVLGSVWVIAILGISLRAAISNLPRYVTNTLYIVLGWLAAIVVAANLHLPAGGLALLVAGGAIYSFGFVMFVVEQPNIIPGRFGFHELWHSLVLLAASCHYFLLYFYVLPR